MKCVVLLYLLQVSLAHVLISLHRPEKRMHIKRSANSDDSFGKLSLQNGLAFYEAKLLIGTPAQEITVQIDTGSSDLWIPSVNNPLSSSIDSSSKTPGFDETKSETYERNLSLPHFRIIYKDQTFAAGRYAQDDIGLSHEDSAFVVKNANFAVAEITNSSEAVWGIGLKSSESMARYVNFKGEVFPTYANIPLQMKQQGLIDRVAYSLWLNEATATKGSLLFGAIDHAKYGGELLKVPIIRTQSRIAEPVSLSVMLHGLTLYNSRNESAPLVQCSVPVLLDSGTTLSQLPTALFDQVASAFGAQYNAKLGAWTVTATDKQKRDGGGIIFNISGIQISVPTSEFLIPLQTLAIPEKRDTERTMQQTGSQKQDVSEDDAIREFKAIMQRAKDKNTYVLGAMPTDPDSESDFILGDTFLRSAYVVYDLEGKEIAIANAVPDESMSNIETIGADGLPGVKRAELYSHTTRSDRVETFDGAAVFNDDASHTAEPSSTSSEAPASPSTGSSESSSSTISASEPSLTSTSMPAPPHSSPRPAHSGPTRKSSAVKNNAAQCTFDQKLSMAGLLAPLLPYYI